VKAFLETECQLDAILENDIRSYVRDQLSKHEYPRAMESFGEMSTTSDGRSTATNSEVSKRSTAIECSGRDGRPAASSQSIPYA
jgi:hypothetical protein